MNRRGAGAALLAFALLTGCSNSKTKVEPSIPAVATDAAGCRTYAKGVKVGKVPDALAELSGLSRSSYPGLFWAHNDSGNALALFALRESGEVVSRVAIRNVTAADPEDVALGPCAPGSAEQCVYLGDIGDNLQAHATRRILRLREPDPLAARSQAVDAEVIAFRYPEGPRDAEGLFVDRRANVYVVTKTPQSLGELYRIPFTAGGRATVDAARIAVLRAPGDKDVYSTAADLHPSGERLIVRTYGHVWEWAYRDAANVEALVAGEPVERPAASGQSQAEAVSYLPEGNGYLLGTEGAGGALVRIDCAG